MKNLRHAAILLLCSLSMTASAGSQSSTPPGKSEVLQGYNLEDFRKRIRSKPADAIEGVWNYTDDAVLVGIERCDDNTHHSFSHRIILLESTDFAIISPGTIVGYIQPTAKKENIYVWLYAETDGTLLSSPVKCTATFENGTITFSRPSIKLRFRLNFARLLPSLFKGLSITASGENATHLPGMVKIYPEEDNPQNIKIRYL